MIILLCGWLSDLTEAGFHLSVRPAIGELGNNTALARGEIHGTQLAIPVSVVLKFVARGYPTLLFSVCRELTVVTVLVRDCSSRVRRTDGRIADGSVIVAHPGGGGEIIPLVGTHNNPQASVKLSPSARSVLY